MRRRCRRDLWVQLLDTLLLGRPRLRDRLGPSVVSLHADARRWKGFIKEACVKSPDMSFTPRLVEHQCELAKKQVIL